MYIPSLNAESRPEVIFDFIEAHSLGALVTSAPSGELFATHLPWLVDRTNGEHGTLRGHIARANPHHQATIYAGLAMLTGFLTELGVIDDAHRPTWSELNLIAPSNPTTDNGRR